ncbi:MAG: hypothetical protein DRO39_09460, partial [Thermoprotei archaeon]
MPTLDIPFPLNGIVHKMLDFAENWAPDLVRVYPDNVALACASVIGVRAKAFITINMMPCNAEVMLIGVPSSGKTTTMTIVRMISSDILMRSGTPEFIEQEMSDYIATNGFLQGVISMDEFARTLKHKERGRYLADMYYLLKCIYDCECIESGRITTKSRFIPRCSYLMNIYMAMTYEDYVGVSNVVDEAFIRRVLVLEYPERLPKRLHRRSMKGLRVVREIMSDLDRCQVNVNIDENLVGHIEAAINEIDSMASRISYACAESCIAYFLRIMAWRAIDRAYTHNKMEKSDTFFDLAAKYLA